MSYAGYSSYMLDGLRPSQASFWVPRNHHSFLYCRAFPFSTGSIKACDLLGFEPTGGGEAGLSALGSG